ncbi:MAG: flagellar biosynthesis protein FliQ [Lachnospiraceae bacterium]|nr:flagellar biosynthesis protein FliQ [Lachnospiraceae bacterium]
MNEQAVLDIASEAIWCVIMTAGPLLIISLLVGLLISIFQTVTSVQEQTLTFVPKIVAIFIAILVFGSFMLNNLVELMETLWKFGEYIR